MTELLYYIIYIIKYIYFIVNIIDLWCAPLTLKLQFSINDIQCSKINYIGASIGACVSVCEKV